MRKWITLVENNDFANMVKSMSAHDAAVDTAGYGYTVDEATPYEITDKHVFSMKNKIEKKMARNPTIYRYVLLRPSVLAKYLEGPLGVYWCHNKDIDVQSLTGWDSAPRDAELYRLTARARIEDVDMARSVLQNLACPWECEIKLNAGASLDLVSVELFADSDQYAKSVRQPFPARPHTA